MSILDKLRKASEELKQDKPERPETDLRPLAEAAGEYKEALLGAKGDREEARKTFVKRRRFRRLFRRKQSTGQ